MDKDKKTYFVETFGCQMNVNDSEKVEGLLQAEGYAPASAATEADFVFINTCAVRERASEKLFHAVGRLRRERKARPQLRIGVGGCVAQLMGTEVLKRAPEIDVLIGTHTIARLPELLRRAEAGEKECVDLDRRADSFAIPDSMTAHGSRVRAYVTAIEGCNHVCSFCVVPRTRGVEVCRPAADIRREVEFLVDRGYAEVMLLGQTVNAYRDGTTDFPALLQMIHDIPHLDRLRFTTSHPVHVTPELADAFRDLPKLCPYLHLPVQSGSDPILASMRRGYTADQYVDVVNLMRNRKPDLALSTDIIVGYPGETEADFEATVALIDRIGFDSVFVFLYSPRPGTAALRLADDVPESEKKRRFQIINDRQQILQASHNAARIGTSESVLIDSLQGAGRVAGRTPHFRIVHTQGDANLLGKIIDVPIRAAGRNALMG